MTKSFLDRKIINSLSNRIVKYVDNLSIYEHNTAYYNVLSTIRQFTY